MLKLKRLLGTKVLIVFDDVNDVSQLELLVGDHVHFGLGSRIIITTRDRRILKKKVNDDKIYKVTGLQHDDALELFQLNAFKNSSTIFDYTELSRIVVGYVGGIPLALKVLGCLFLHYESKEDWEDELNMLKEGQKGPSCIYNSPAVLSCSHHFSYL